MDEIQSKVALYAFPALLGIVIYFVKRFIDRVDKELERVSSSASKFSLNLMEKTSEIRLSLTTLELSMKNTSEKVHEYSKRIADCVAKLDKHQEMHLKTSEILREHNKGILQNRDNIHTIVRIIGDKTIVSEVKKKS